MSLIDDMYQGKPLPQNVDQHRLMQMRLFLEEKLIKELGKSHRWLAYATIAVDAGSWRGRRLSNRRKKLIKMIDHLRDRLGLPELEPQLEDGWSEVGLFYGYGAIEKYGREQSKMNSAQLIIVGFLNAKKISAQNALSMILEEDDGEHSIRSGSKGTVGIKDRHKRLT